LIAALILPRLVLERGRSVSDRFYHRRIKLP
jgi:hypothetical protein